MNQSIAEVEAAYDAACVRLDNLSKRYKDVAEGSEQERDLHADMDEAVGACDTLKQRLEDTRAATRARAKYRTIPLSEGGHVRIGVNEPDRYERGGRSFFHDLYAAQVKQDPSAQERIAEHHVYEVERRALTTSTLGGIVPPQYLVELYAKAPRRGRVFADRLNRDEPLPDQGMVVIVPRLTQGAAADAQAAENDTVATQDVIETDYTANVRTIAGYIPVSRQSLERANYSETILMEDLIARYASTLDVQLLTGDGNSGRLLGALSLTSGNDSPGPASTTLSSTDMKEAWGAVLDVSQQISTAMGGLSYEVDTIVMHPRRWAAFLATTDDDHRPLFTAEAGAMNIVGQGAANQYGRCGTLLGIAVYQDANVPTNIGGTQDAIILLSSQANLLFEQRDGQPTTLAFEQQAGTELAVRLIVYSYAAVAWRYPQAVGFITGSGLTTPDFGYTS